MSPARYVYRFAYYSFPRVSGDEAAQPRKTRGLLQFSPRERG